jgi:signal transduction histidine kinase
MCCVLNSTFFFQSGTRRIVSFFFILWSCAGISLFLHTLLLKHHIQQQRLGEISTALSSYIEHNNSSGKSRFSLRNSIPKEIDFIRIVHAEQQLLITGNNSMAFHGLVDLDPLSNGAWIDLLQPQNSGNWLLISQKLPHGGVAQAGTNDQSTGLAIYKQAVIVSSLMFLLLALPCLCLAFLFAYLIKAPLQSLEITVRNALEENSLLIQQKEPENKDLTPIFNLLEETFSQNRQLIAEMQSSLDNVAHDLRTPMTRLRAVAEYALQSDKEEPALYRSALSDCLEESERVLSMLKIMMSVAEAEAGTMRLELQELDIMETLEDVVGLYQYVAEEEQITVVLEKGKGSFPVLADKTRISQVWANLLDNAIKYGHESGNIRINVATNEHFAIIRFYDDGMGISKTEIDRIWERLYRGDRSRTKQGLGLGLNYVKAVVEAHGGQIMVTSKIKKGSCFEVRLPLISSTLTRKLEITQ